MRVATTAVELVGPDTLPSVRCDIAFVATPAGTAKGIWTGVKLRYFAGVDRQSPLDSAFIAAADGPLFAHDTILAARADTSEWRFTSPYPFSIEADFQYRRLGSTETQHAPARTDCGAVPPTNAAAPTAEVLEIRGSDPTLEAGDTLIVRYRLTGPAGLWRSVLSVNGPFQASRGRFEGQATTVEREDRFVVPRHSIAGQFVGVNLRLTDNTGRESVQALPTGIRFVDVDRPVVNAVSIRASREFVVGEWFDFSYAVSDDNDVAWVIFQLEGGVSVRDSVPVHIDGAEPYENGFYLALVQAAWVGKEASFALWTRDAAGNVSDTVRLSSPPITFRAPALRLSGAAMTSRCPRGGGDGAGESRNQPWSRRVRPPSPCRLASYAALD